MIRGSIGNDGEGRLRRLGLSADVYRAELGARDAEVTEKVLCRAYNAAMKGTCKQFRAFIELCRLEGLMPEKETS